MTGPNACSSGTDPRTMVIAACREMRLRGLTHGISGNVSVRYDARRFFVSLSGMDYEILQADDVPLMDLNGRWFGHRRPSSEWRFHRDISARGAMSARSFTRIPHKRRRSPAPAGIPAFH
jgi:L-fuculose-phosphate aldolase